MLIRAAVFPMPVLMVAAYDGEGTVQVMNAAWGMICGMDKIALFIDEDHKTTKSIRETKAFTVSIAEKGSFNFEVAFLHPTICHAKKKDDRKYC